jgi:hypothetical protein
MKKTLVTMMMLMALLMGAEAMAQNHRHTPRAQEELVDTSKQGAIEVFSDTTTVADSASASAVSDSWDDEDEFYYHTFKDLVGDMTSKDLTGIAVVLGSLFILFVMAPVLIIIALFYFINKNRKDKIKLAQMAVQQGQPIPEQLLENKQETVNDEYQKGLRQCFVGVGLMIFLGLTAGEVGFGIGALVFCIGLGKIVAGKMAEKKNRDINQ